MGLLENIPRLLELVDIIRNSTILVEIGQAIEGVRLGSEDEAEYEVARAPFGADEDLAVHGPGWKPFAVDNGYVYYRRRLT